MAENCCQVSIGKVDVVIGGETTGVSPKFVGKNVKFTCAKLAGFIGSLLSIRAQALARQTCPGLAGKSPWNTPDVPGAAPGALALRVFGAEWAGTPWVTNALLKANQPVGETLS